MPRKLQPTKVKPHGMIELEDPRHGIDAVVLPDCIQTECRAIVQEHSRSDELKAFGLAPRHKILLHGEPGNGKPSSLKLWPLNWQSRSCVLNTAPDFGQPWRNSAQH